MMHCVSEGTSKFILALKVRPQSINQSINVYLYSPLSQMLHLSQWTSQFVQTISMTIRHPLSLDPHIVQGKTSKETPQF